MTIIAGLFGAIGKIPRWVWLGILFIAILSGVYLLGESHGATTTQASNDKQSAQHSAKVASAVISRVGVVRAQEASATASQQQIGVNLQKEIQNEIQKRDRLITDLRAGRLRQPASCTRDRDDLPAIVATGSGNDGEARTELYRADFESEELIRIGSDADQIVHQLAACQAAAINDRALINHD